MSFSTTASSVAPVMVATRSLKLPRETIHFLKWKSEFETYAATQGFDHHFTDKDEPLPYEVPPSTAKTTVQNVKFVYDFNRSFTKTRAQAWQALENITEFHHADKIQTFGPSMSKDGQPHPHPAWKAICSHYDELLKSTATGDIYRLLGNISPTSTGDPAEDLAKVRQEIQKCLQLARACSPPVIIPEPLLNENLLQGLNRLPFFRDNMTSFTKGWETTEFDTLCNSIEKFVREFRILLAHKSTAHNVGEQTGTTLMASAAPPPTVEEFIALFTKQGKPSYSKYKKFTASIFAPKPKAPRHEDPKPEKQKTSKLCTICKKRGHLADDCWHKDDPKRSAGNSNRHREVKDTTFHCEYCDADGHTISFCSKLNAKLKQDSARAKVIKSHRANLATATVTPTNEELTAYILLANTIAKCHSTSIFHLDSGATNHVCNRFEMFNSLEDVRRPIVCANGEITYALGIGCIGSLANVLYAPEFVANLVSISMLEQLGFSINFKDSRCTLYSQSLSPEGIIIGSKTKEGLYACTPAIFSLPASAISTTLMAVYIPGVSPNQLWHLRLNHCCHSRLRSMFLEGMATSFTFTSKLLPFCDACSTGKIHKTSTRDTPQTTHKFPRLPDVDRASSSSASSTPLGEDLTTEETDDTDLTIQEYLREATKPLSKFVMDLKGPMPMSRDHKRYILLITDYKTRYRWIYFLAGKDETL